MKAPPLLPQPLVRFLVAGVLVSLLATLVASFIEPAIPDPWLFLVAKKGQLAIGTLVVSMSMTLGISALWAAAYLSCWPYLYVRYRHEKRNRPARERAQAEVAQAKAEQAEQAQRLREQVQMGGPPSPPIEPPPNHLPAIGESWESRNKRAAEARVLHAQCVEQVEAQVLNAFARYSLNSDFLGAVPQQELFRAFGARVDKLGIREISLLHESTNPTIRRLLTYAPILSGGLMMHERMKPYIKPYEPPPDSPLNGPFIKRYISGL